MVEFLITNLCEGNRSMNIKSALVCRVKKLTSELLSGKNGRMFLPRHLSCKELSTLRESYGKGNICAAEIVGIYRRSHANDKDLGSFLPDQSSDNENLIREKLTTTALMCMPVGFNLPATTLLDRIGGGENIDQQRLKADMDAFKLAENNLAVIKKEYEITLALHGHLLELVRPRQEKCFQGERNLKEINIPGRH